MAQAAGAGQSLSGASRTFVITDQDELVCGYYAMAAGAVAHREAIGAVRRSMPDRAGDGARKAVDQRVRGMQLGGALLQDALERATTVAQNTGVRALVVHALNERAKAFYEHYGFQASPLHPMTLMLRLPSLRA